MHDQLLFVTKTHRSVTFSQSSIWLKDYIGHSLLTQSNVFFYNVNLLLYCLNKKHRLDDGEAGFWQELLGSHRGCPKQTYKDSVLARVIFALSSFNSAFIVTYIVLVSLVFKNNMQVCLKKISHTNKQSVKNIPCIQSAVCSSSVLPSSISN